MKAITLSGPNPGCAICAHLEADPIQPAICDVPTTMGPWAYLCVEHNMQYGCGGSQLGNTITWTG